MWELRLDDLHEQPVSEVAAPMHPTYGSQINVTADGRYVCALLMEDSVDLYTSDVSGYANLYLAPVGDLDDLPVLDLEAG